MYAFQSINAYLYIAKQLMKVKFLGAAQQVTGSMYMLRLDDGYTVLIDCGLDYTKEGNEVLELPFNPQDIDLIVISHAHIDHTGLLPVLTRQGFNGHIICTTPTAELVQHLLFDSANLQWMEYRKILGKTRKNRQHRIPKPAYNLKDVDGCLKHIYTLPFRKPWELKPGLNMEFIEAGHILGAASIRFTIVEQGKEKTIAFTGDLGRKGSLLLKDPVNVGPVDYLISEATYGGRKHKVTKTPQDELLDYITETCIKYKGRLIIPAFSVGRTQSILFTINKLKRNGQIPADLKVFADSPLAFKSTNIYEKFSSILNDETQQFIKEKNALFRFEGLEQLDSEDADSVVAYRDSFILISSAGMVEGGRIQQHVANHIDYPFCTILIAGFCAPHTLGYRLMQGLKQITIKNKLRTVHAKIAQTDVFSAHPDSDELFDYMFNNVKNGVKKIFLTHGEPEMLNAMKLRLNQANYEHVIIPEIGYEFNC